MANKKTKPEKDEPQPATCGLCCYWIRLPSDTKIESQDGECRRMPPQLLHDPSENTPYALWPIVEDTDFCGEWRARMNA